MLDKQKGFRPLDGESFSKLMILKTPFYDISFRPLDGESFSKLALDIFNAVKVASFRPLDGESFSKLAKKYSDERWNDFRFRPLDGESFSKRRSEIGC